MCAIVGCVSDGPQHPVDRERLIRATRSMEHRGPDGMHVFVDVKRQFGLGHCRLAVNGGPGAVQPISNCDETLFVVVNGELYDPENRLRRRLVDRGHRFSGVGDSELALHLYAEYGLEFVDHLRGEFAILVYDVLAGQMVAVRDRFGIKPLVYTRSRGETWFASQAKAFSAAGLALRTDLDSVWHVMSFQYTLPDRTIYENVFQLPPGHLAISRDTMIDVRCYWDLDYPRQLDTPNGRQVEDPFDQAMAFAEEFDEAVRIRLRGDVPVVSHLSGGIDSCAVLQSAVRQGGVAAAFSIGFPGEVGHDESKLAGEMAEQLGVFFQSVDGSPGRLIEAMNSSVSIGEGWAVNGHLPAKFLLSRAISEAGYKVALTGEGADELLAGYAHLKIDLCTGRDAGLVQDVVAENLTSYGTMIPTQCQLDTTSIKHSLGYVPAFLAAKASQGAMMHSHLRDDFLDRFRGRDPMDELCAQVVKRDQMDGRNVVHQSLYFWMKTALAQNILRTLGDGCESAHGTEGRLPMLDHHLFQWVRKQPMKFLIRPAEREPIQGARLRPNRPFIEKWLLRTAMRGRLPPHYVDRPKHPFDAPPLANCMRKYPWIRDRIESAIDNHPYFDPKKVRVTLDRIDDADAKTKTAVDPLWWMVLSSAIVPVG
ncbi:MAG: asparagine synthase (glutamine-hydrolyzing) [Planctomycetales bacterium]|nr:asparagine synthase (glutamine-hydrolyzing) [Planctomycetales bacterium]